MGSASSLQSQAASNSTLQNLTGFHSVKRKLVALHASLLTKEYLALPSTCSINDGPDDPAPKQPIADLDTLYEQATSILPSLKNFISDVARAAGLDPAGDPDHIIPQGHEGGHYPIAGLGPLKGRERAMEKTRDGCLPSNDFARWACESRSR